MKSEGETPKRCIVQTLLELTCVYWSMIASSILTQLSSLPYCGRFHLESQKICNWDNQRASESWPSQPASDEEWPRTVEIGNRARATGACGEEKGAERGRPRQREKTERGNDAVTFRGGEGIAGGGRRNGEGLTIGEGRWDETKREREGVETGDRYFTFRSIWLSPVTSRIKIRHRFVCSTGS